MDVSHAETADARRLKLLGDRLHFAGRNPLHGHLRQRRHQRPLRTLIPFEQLGREPPASLSRALCFALVLILSGNVSHSQEDKPPSPLQIFYDDKILIAAATEILSMNYDSTKSLTNVLAFCEKLLTENEIIQRDCQSAMAKFNIEFGSGSALDDVLFAYNLIAAGIRSGEKVHRREPDVGKMILRMTAIDRQLRRAANARFRELRTQQH